MRNDVALYSEFSTNWALQYVSKVYLIFLADAMKVIHGCVEWLVFKCCLLRHEISLTAKGNFHWVVACFSCCKNICTMFMPVKWIASVYAFLSTQLASHSKRLYRRSLAQKWCWFFILGAFKMEMKCTSSSSTWCPIAEWLPIFALQGGTWGAW